MESKKYDKGEKEAKKDEEKQPAFTKNEEIAFHQGALQVLASEYNEMVRMAKTVETIMKAHLDRLQQLGIKFEAKKEK
jgi:hypothetical protein